MAFSKSTELLKALKDFGVAYGAAAVPLANGKALELWLMLKLAAGAKKDGWTVELTDGAGHALTPGASFKPRGQHGKIRAASSSAPGFIRLSKDRPDGTAIVVELHDSLQWNGRSDASHECDLSVIDADVAQTLRTNGGGHPIGLPLIAIECKDKDSAGPIGDVREKVARMFDLTHTTKVIPQNGHRHFDQTATVASEGGTTAMAMRGGMATSQSFVTEPGNLERPSSPTSTRSPSLKTSSIPPRSTPSSRALPPP